jgi:hypothetical protein
LQPFVNPSDELVVRITSSPSGKRDSVRGKMNSENNDVQQARVMGRRRCQFISPVVCQKHVRPLLQT